MLIEELTEEASLGVLARTSLGRIACAQGAQPYIVPLYFTYDHEYLYSFSTVGQKIEWMRANPLVCVETDELESPQQWLSVIVLGLYEELPDTPAYQQKRAAAQYLLQKRAMWWEVGCAKTILHGIQRPLVPVFYRIHIVQISGHRARPEPASAPDTRLSRMDLAEDS